MSDRSEEFDTWYTKEFGRRPTAVGYETDIARRAWQASREALEGDDQASVPKGASLWPVINSLVEDYIDGYEFRGDDGDYMPNETERFWIKDCVAGLLDELSQKGFITTPSKADEWNAFIKRKQAEAVENAFMDLAASIRKIEGLDGISVKGLIHAAEEYATALLSTEEQDNE